MRFKCAPLSLPHRSPSPTPISHPEFYLASLPVDSIGVVHRATEVSIGCIGLVYVRESRSSSCSSCSSCSSRSPIFPLGFEVNPRDRATHGVLDLIIWYQQLLVTADLTFHPLDFVLENFPKNPQKIALNCLLTDL